MERRDRHFVAHSRGRKQPAGFTLVELLVVIGIIAVLIAVLLPVLGKARAQANRTVCLSNIRQLGVGILMYCQDNKGWFPTCAFWQVSPSYVQYPDDWIHWQANRNLDDSAIAKYVGRGEKLKSLLRCPADTFEVRKTHPGISAGQGPYLYSYAMNDAIAVNVKPPNESRTKLNQWRLPSKKILLTENLESLVFAPVWSYGTELTHRHGVGRSTGRNAFASPGKRIGINVSATFLDGHAEPVNDDLACLFVQARPEAR